MKVGVIGAGALGTAIYQNISKNLRNVFLYARREKVVNDINDFNCNKDYFPKIKLNDNITLYTNYEFDEKTKISQMMLKANIFEL